MCMYIYIYICIYVCMDSGEGVSDYCRAVVPVGRVVTGSECEVPPYRTSPREGAAAARAVSTSPSEFT